MTYNDLFVGLLKRSTSHSSCLIKHMLLDILPSHSQQNPSYWSNPSNLSPWSLKKSQEMWCRDATSQKTVETIGPIFRNSQTEVRIRSKDENHVNCKWNAGVCKCSWPSSMCLCSKVIGMCWARMLGNCTNTHQPQYMAHLQTSALWSGKHCASSAFTISCRPTY